MWIIWSYSVKYKWYHYVLSNIFGHWNFCTMVKTTLQIRDFYLFYMFSLSLLSSYLLRKFGSVKLKDLPKVTQLLNGKARIWNKNCLALKLASFFSALPKKPLAFLQLESKRVGPEEHGKISVSYYLKIYFEIELILLFIYS